MTSRPAMAMAALSRSLIIASMLAAAAACGGTDEDGGGGSTATPTDDGGGQVAEIDETGDTTGQEDVVETEDALNGEDADTTAAECVGSGCGEPDAGADGGPEDGGAKPDVVDPPLDCPGGPGCDCSKNDDCDNAFCIDTPGGKKCAKTCVNDCPEGFTCKAPGSSDTVFICMPDHLVLCAP